ncbi:RING finger protein 37 [Venturia canescens]|uniref:RING finger protein 37 n=1 Tax=Venturia canescens TaxID=32260 RepID=UPI001C9CC261|nr:RING finger protein 37 [Venturia canescens]
MLINFCRKCMESSVTCSTVSNDGYEVTNLTSDSNQGFLAYSCIKPPIHIDFSFTCNVRMNHILIWPSVGAQKSSGFEISVKSANQYKQVSTGFLKSEHSGLLFYRRDLDSCSINIPQNFLCRYLKLSYEQNLENVQYLRISILRTENSVPAIGRVEIWGEVSAFNSRDTIQRVYNLWQHNNVGKSLDRVQHNNNEPKHGSETSRASGEESLNVPDCFLDPITCNIMIQPIVLPSGTIIDQDTLEKHGKTEATWGRPLSDPFTGIPFSESRKPIIASALKARIDKYLLENKHAPDVKNLPRLSGHKQVVMSMRNRPLELSRISSSSTVNDTVLETVECTNIFQKSLKPPTPVPSSKIRLETRVHRLPIIPMCSKRTTAKSDLKKIIIKTFGISAFKKEIKIMPEQESNVQDGSLDHTVNSVLSNLQRFNGDKQVKKSSCVENCKCVSNIFYKLPCDHVLCRDILMTVKDSRCLKCKLVYDTRDLERIHGELTIREKSCVQTVC